MINKIKIYICKVYILEGDARDRFRKLDNVKYLVINVWEASLNKREISWKWTLQGAKTHRRTLWYVSRNSNKKWKCNSKTGNRR